MKQFKLSLLVFLCTVISGCSLFKAVDMVASAALTTVEVAAKVTVKAVELAIPDADESEDPQEEDAD